ncbi:MAG: tRNA (adenosine(37)-N6)-threonylcarbamoyltransferase complex dimerization subunit type 1 TsaB [Roseburia sp.]|nr:tRNA (adenosine(37)-N6)-threonylcarbamoyltransferase complex dimerization subunit type 1 TsaB [Roseburia sp.]MCM1277776.1 tRNA (adenosine(37)-N6)-threonylcarbamoyltransferase complex dimerization subunit type 1 TsaB [Robinsoniella sp.]
MKILALDSSGLVAGIAVIQDEIMLASYTINYKKTHSQTLLPMLEQVCKMIELDMETIDAIAVAAGPGSFTGLRIGSATAKGLGLALDKPIVEVGTVEAIAYQLYGVEKIICPMLDARRNQVYTGLYTFQNENGKSSFKTLLKQCAVSVEEIIGTVNGMGKEVVFLGDGVPVYEEVVREQAKVPYEFAPAYCNRQNAGALGTLACAYFKKGQFVSADQHKPEYLRMSQAERERLEKEEKKK